ncbi:MAG: aminodeoxychorismate/anthranilate synthase component II [Bacteroidota bacterium]
MILVIDNYDSFTYNLVQLLGNTEAEVVVRRNDQISVEEIRTMRPARIVISPGPGRPEAAGITMALISALAPSVPILGVCLGHQAIGASYGGKVVHAPVLMHGMTSEVQHCGAGIFRSVPNPFTATRYHSLVVSREGFPRDLEITAEADDGVIMALRHRSYPLIGVQFHPESILTTEGPRLIKNWLAEEL